MTDAKRQNYVNATGAALTAFLCICTSVVIWFAIRNTIPQENREFVTLIIGWLTAKLSTIIDWHYGGSSTNKQQSETISTLATTNATAQAALTPSTPDVTLPPGRTLNVAAEDSPTT